jgi:hypothetical protein
MNDMERNQWGSNGAHMIPSWDDVWKRCEESPAVTSYDDGKQEITWCDGSSDIFLNTHDALNAISDMEAN